MVENGIVISLLALIVTIDLAQFGVTLEHRGRLSAVEERLSDPMRTDGGEPDDAP